MFTLVHSVSELVESYLRHLQKLFFQNKDADFSSENYRKIAVEYTPRFEGISASELASMGREHCSFVTKKLREALENRHLMNRSTTMVQLYCRMDQPETMQEVFANLFADIVILLGSINHCVVVKKKERTELTVTASREFVNALRL